MRKGNQNTTSSSGGAVAFLLFIFMAPGFAMGLGLLASFFKEGAAFLNLPVWMWQFYWVCVGVCVATGIYTKRWMHCTLLALIVITFFVVGAGNSVASGNFDSPIEQSISQIWRGLGDLAVTVFPFIAATAGLYQAYATSQQSRRALQDEDSSAT